MNSRKVVWVWMVVGSTLGGCVPMIWGQDLFSFSSVLFSAIGAIIGIYFGYKLSN
jgi:hypothetical protein